VESHLDARLDYWNKQRQIPGRVLAYDRLAGAADDVAGLLQRPESGPWRLMTCATSLRNVEPGIRLLLAPESDAVAVVDEPSFQPRPVPADDEADKAESAAQGGPVAAAPDSGPPAAAGGEGAS
jgi:hypothetical protein